MPTWEELQPYIDKVGQVITEMAKGLGVASEHVYSVLVRQEMMFGGVLMLAGIIIILVFMACVRWMFKNDIDDEVFWSFTIIGGIIALLVFIFAVCQGAMHLLSPEYYAIKNVIDMMQSLVHGTPQTK